MSATSRASAQPNCTPSANELPAGPHDRPIVVRKMGFDFSDVPRHWFGGSGLMTHMANGLNLVFPEGERFFIRSVKHSLDAIADEPELVARCRAFFGQEGSHGHEHENAFRVLERQGFEIREWLKWYESTAYTQLERRLPPNLRLSATAALEHLTATLAAQGLSTDHLDSAHPVMRQLLRWHASEEIEHKSVAFDVLQKVDARYWVRVTGLFVGLASLLYYWRSAATLLLKQDGITKAQVSKERKAARARGQNRNHLWRGFLQYLRPGFHPDDNDDYGLARAYLEKIGRLAG